jgi:acetyl-CoA carboxylase carboxyltransferase component
LDEGTHAGSVGGLVASPAVSTERTVTAPLTGTVEAVPIAVGDVVGVGGTLVVIESMKMEHLVVAEEAGTVKRLEVAAGETVRAGDPLVLLGPVTVATGTKSTPDPAGDAPPSHPDPTTGVERPLRPDLAAVVARHEVGLDRSRPEAVARRRAAGHRTAREDVADLCDPGTFVEYGPLAVAAQRRRRELDDLIRRTPADGLVGGVGKVDGQPTVVMSYDYTVLAGTQGLQNHRKKDRLFELAAHGRLPVVLFAEGGGGRPGDTDGTGISGLDCLAFRLFGELSARVPLVGIATGRCFAGNAALLGCCDVVIATEGTNIGMGGPAMIEGGGLGVFTPDDIGPLDVQVANGVVDIAVADQAEAVDVARRYLGYMTPPDPAPGWTCADQEALRDVVPENRRRVYDIRAVLGGLADTDSVLELRAGFAPGIVTALTRVEGRTVAVVANNPAVAGGAITADAADKAARFLQLCDAFDLPVLFLCDTPGFMVGPEAERTALVRHVSRLFVIGANLDVPVMTVIVRKGYGLGAQSMAGGSFKSPMFTVGWPTSEIGGMGLEGAVRLGYRKELEAIADPVEREAAFERMVAHSYEMGRGLSAATVFEIDDVIDPADTRRWIVTALDAAAPAPNFRQRTTKKRPWIDTW